MPAAVLFDWGDTLMGYEWNPEVALRGARAGLAALSRDRLPEAEAVVAWFQDRDPQVFAVAEEDEADLGELVGSCFSELGCRLEDDDVRLYLRATHDSWSESYTVEATSHALLESLRSRGLKLALVSNTAQPEWLLRPLLDRQGLAERVDAIVLSSEVGKRKPHPAIFEAALSRLGVEAADALFVGDRLYEDVLGAKRVGMRTVQALWFRADENPEGAEPDFEAFTQLDVLNIVRRLAAS